MAQKYTDEQLITMLQEFAEDLGRTPSVSDINDCDTMPSRSTYRTRFGTWNKALEVASLQPNEVYSYSRYELLEAIIEVGDELDRRPTREEFHEQTGIAESPFRREFGSWSNALEEAGFSKNRRHTDAELIDALRDFSNYKGHAGAVRTPTKREMDEDGPHSASLYADRFGSWTHAVVEAGLNPDTRRTPRDDLLDEIARVAEILDKRPTYRDMTNFGDFSPDTYERIFGSWNNALREAGFEPATAGRPKQTYEHSVGDLVTELRRVTRNFGRPPTEKEFTEHSEYSSTTYVSRFGSWNAALERAGLGVQRGSTSPMVDAPVPYDNDESRDAVEIYSDGDSYRLQIGDGLADLRSDMVYEIIFIGENQIKGWPVGCRGDLSRTFPMEELKEKLAARSRKVEFGGRNLIHYPS